MSMKKKLILVLLSLGLLALAGYRVLPAVQIENQTGNTIDLLIVEVSGQRLSFGRLDSGKSAQKSLRITTDSRFMVNYQLTDGTSVRLPVGHIEAPAWWSRTRITIGEYGALDITY